uniref:Uncharacterized protein n=1 Tax=Enterovibrio norvegicus TaxID=188144 RepID=A0A0H3ZXB9_9GAMM|nr:hypothetical protein [Enterovibrio norvegicus]
MKNGNSYIYKSSNAGLSLVYLLETEVQRIKKIKWSKRNGKDSKMALVFESIALTQGVKTDAARRYANCSNIPNMVDNINKKIMSLGLMIVRVDPWGVPPNADFHHWYLVEAPIMNVPVQMAVNDPIM